MVVNEPNSADTASPEEWRAELRTWVDRELAAALPPATTRPPVVHEAMRYACLNGGKRIRALLTLEFCHAFGGSTQRALRPALALEAFHASTLIHDDLPCMDDDALRRGHPSTHIRFGEANALLAGNALLTLSLQWMAETPVPPPHPPSALATELARAGGSRGVIGGQVEDLEAEREPPSEDRLRFIHTEKTARLIACACRVGMICAGACASWVDRAGEFGLDLGRAFQIQDDILDVTQSSETLGKPSGSDQTREKLTAVRCWGLEASRRKARDYTDAARAHLEALDTSATRRIAELADALLRRDQ